MQKEGRRRDCYKIGVEKSGGGKSEIACFGGFVELDRNW